VFDAVEDMQYLFKREKMRVILFLSLPPAPHDHIPRFAPWKS
jgi:hypothetical protein